MARPTRRPARRAAPSDPPRIRVGISSCLLGEAVRWDGGHRRDRTITDTLGACFEWVPVCPEIELGMGIPREPVRLAGETGAPRMVGVRSGRDWTERMVAYARRRVAALDGQQLCGYLLKSDSPSCGMERVRVHPEKGRPSRSGVGLFARELMRRMPLLPVEEEGRLRDPARRESFIERVFACRRWRDLVGTGLNRGALVAFHADHKFLILSHSPRHYRELGRLVAVAKRHSPSRMKDLYGESFMAALKIPATVRKNFNVLQHLAGYLRDHLDSADRRELEGVLEDYRRERVPLVVPLTLLRHHADRHRIECVRSQVYLHPHPRELMLRNRV